MRRLAWKDILFLGTLLPYWLAIFALHVHVVATTGLPQVQPWVSAPTQGERFPRVRGFMPGGDPTASGLRPGDLVLSVGETSLEGAGYARFEGIVLQEARRHGSAAVLYERNAVRSQAVLRPIRSWPPWARTPTIATTALIAVILLFRIPEPARARRVFVTLLSVCILTTHFAGGPPWQTVWSRSSQLVFGIIAPSLGLILSRDFPEARARESLWARVLPWIFAPAYGLLRATFWLGWPAPVAKVPALIMATDGIVVSCVLLYITRNYRTGDALARRQIKWVLFGDYVAFAPWAIAGLIPLVEWLRPWHPVAWGFAQVASAAAPLGFFAAVQSARIWDIDRIISVAATGSLLLAAGFAAILVVVPRFADPLSELTRLPTDTCQMLLSIAIAAAAVPAGSRLRPWMEGLLFAERHAAVEGLSGLVDQLSTLDSPEEVVSRVGAHVARLLEPDSVVLYAREQRVFRAVFAVGRVLPPAFDVEGPLAHALGRGELLRVDDARVRGRLDAVSRGVIERLDAVLLVPARQRGELRICLSLGRKRSGDIYTATDGLLLQAVVGRASAQIDLFEEAALAREARQRQGLFERYVPSAIVRELERGVPIEPREAEATVVFVDVRGYTAFAERAAPELVFSTIGRYAAVVTRAIARFGGHVVDFSGDGVMAVFGVPEPLLDKEAAALRSAREVLAELATLRADGTRIEAGVGIATGPVVVGTIPSEDRWTWSVLGDTTNRAARLQALTREVDASIVTDATTADRAPDATADFELMPSVPIRGRQGRIDAYRLRRDAGPRLAVVLSEASATSPMTPAARNRP